MALFKILKGNSSRISTDITPFHDGYAYFTPDDGGFYIDSEDNGEQKRHRVNPKGSTAISATLSASGWSGKQQVVSVPGMTSSTDGMIGLSQTVSESAVASAKKAELYVKSQGNGALTIAARGETPSENIPVVIVLLN